MSEAINIVSDNSSGEAYDICLMVDGGGSTFLNNKTDMLVYGDGRIIHNIIGFNLWPYGLNVLVLFLCLKTVEKRGF